MRASRSIRARLLISILASLVLILGITALVSYGVIKRESDEIFGARLATSARVFESLIARQVEHSTVTNPIVIALPKELEHTASNEATAFGHPYETKIAFQVWRDDGTLLVRSASAPERPFGPNAEGFSKRELAGDLWQVFVLRSGNSWIQVAEKNEVRTEMQDDLGIAVMTPLIVGALLLLMVANLLVHYGLAPLRELAASIQAREPDALGPLELREVPHEVIPVVQALNDLLARVRHAFERERRFTDSAAHELRTPLAALKIHADNMIRTESAVERAHSMAKLREGLDRANKLADQMLAYTRAQDVHDHELRAPVRLANIVAETVTSLEPLRRRKAQRVRIATSPEAAEIDIIGEPMKLHRLISNLLDNASRYAPDGSEIAVRLSIEGGRIALHVSNPGSAIPLELRTRVFEPYYRVPGSASEGSGLGLAIVKEIADQHGAAIELSELDGDTGTVVTVTFPI